MVEGFRLLQDDLAAVVVHHEWLAVVHDMNGAGVQQTVVPVLGVFGPANEHISGLSDRAVRLVQRRFKL